MNREAGDQRLCFLSEALFPVQDEYHLLLRGLLGTYTRVSYPEEGRAHCRGLGRMR